MYLLFKNFSEKLNEELNDMDFSSLYEDIDILGAIPEYDEICRLLEDKNSSKEEIKKIQKEFNKIEKASLSKNKLVKIKGEDKNYYCLKNEVYDNIGIMIEDNYSAYLEDNDIFCEYNNDNIYMYMKNILNKKIKKYSDSEEEYY